MSDDTREMESLSALMDGEVDEMELHRTLKRVSEDDELRQTWHRYQLVAATMRRELPEQAVDISDRVRQAIDEEADLSKATAIARVAKPFGRFAIAASVAALAVIGVQQYNSPPAGQPDAGSSVAAVDGVAIDLNAPGLIGPSEFGVPRISARTVSAGSKSTSNYADTRPVIVVKQVAPDQATQEQIQTYLNDLMFRHTEHAALNNNQGMLTFARMPQTREKQ